VTAASLVIALGLITLTGYFIGHNLRVDQVLFEAQLAGNRVAPNTGIALLLIGVALWLQLAAPFAARASNRWRCFNRGRPHFAARLCL
jgi:hypothetical protein